MHRQQLFALLLVPLLAWGQPSGWRDRGGQVIPNSDSMKTVAGFAGTLLVTTDEDWKQKWETPPDTTPNFNRAEDVPYGKRVYVLIFFANPKPDASGEVKVNCDLQITSPTGKVTFQQNGMSCFVGKIAGSLTNMYLSSPVLAFSGDPGDPAGTWLVQAKLRDEVRAVELPLRYEFRLRK